MAGAISGLVHTGGQAVKHLHRIEAETPDYLRNAWPALCQVVGE